MTGIHHIHCGTLHAPPYPKAICHGLLLEDKYGLALVDAGIGLLDGQQPLERLGKPLIEMAGFQFNESETAVRQVEQLGFRTADVEHILLTHGDPDHAGGLVDFAHAEVHISAEEHASIVRGNWRYVPIQFAHAPRWREHAPSSRLWFGLEARAVPLGFESEVLLIPLLGHTVGHCGVAIQQEDHWVLHVGDAYYLRVETTTDGHPVSQLTAQRADDNALRVASLAHIRRLLRDHADEIELFGYHDPDEFPQAAA